MSRSPAPVAVLFVLALGLGCGDDEPMREPVVELAPADAAAAVRVGLDAAHRAWSAGDRPAASEQVRTTYSDAFEPIEPALRRQDPENTLRLEYAFGALAEKLAAKGDPVAVAGEVKGLVDAVEAAVGALPVPAEQAAAAAELAAPMTVTPVSPPKRLEAE